MNNKDIRNFLGDDFDFFNAYVEFKSKALKTRFIDNEGGMDLVEGTWLYSILQKIKPMCFIESGVWRGFSSWIFDEVNDYCAKHILYDPGFFESGFNNLLKHKVANGHYFYEDFGSTRFSGVAKNATIFFDDHQDYLERLLLSYSRGAKYAIFDDNYFFGGGGHHSLLDHFRDTQNYDLFKVIVKEIYIIPPLTSTDKGIPPMINEANIGHLIDKYQLEDHGYQWLTLVELNQCNTSPKSQGELRL